MRVLVCDDQMDRAEEARDAISESGIDDVEVEVLAEGELETALGQLFKRVKDCVKEPANYQPEGVLRFDQCDLVIFDNNLTELNVGGARLTAEAMVGYVRAFSKCPYCVSLNKNPDIDFDLRYLVGDYETRADLAVNTEHLANLGLWTGKPEDTKDGFLPWYWPSLRKAPGRRRKQIKFVREHIEKQVLAALELPANEPFIGYLSLHGRGSLVPSKRLAEWRFIDVFLERDRSLPAETREDRERISQATGNEYIASLVARVIASDVDLWFRRDLVAPQEMLVDVAHLLMRMPFLLNGDPTKIETWNQAAHARQAPFGMNEDYYSNHIEQTRFETETWVQRPMFNWPQLKENADLDELFFRHRSPDFADVVFCEDRSLFLERSPAKSSPPQEFAAEFEGAWPRRYVARLPQVNYRPEVRFAV